MKKKTSQQKKIKTIEDYKKEYYRRVDWETVAPDNLLITESNGDVTYYPESIHELDRDKIWEFFEKIICKEIQQSDTESLSTKLKKKI